MDVLSGIFLICFGVGLVMVLLSLLTGIGHLPLHVGHLHGAGGHGIAHATGHGGADGASPLNAFSILLFLTWFGGAGFVLHGPLGAWGWLSIAGAVLVGLLAALAVFQFLARVLAPQSVALDPADYRLEGQVGWVSGPIRAGGVGEVQYTQRGRRRAMGARAAGDQPLERGTEVVIVSVERGLALVEPWEQFLAAHAAGGLADSVVARGSASRPATPGEEKRR